ncbi:MAG: polysaccharide lyase family 8 super-sandwich domain-containing protein [Bacteroidales bacterium]|nr:polysaccharide lyase family 8 super-sandwich domain-containing protein [Bacteroidales bacterium]
MKRYITLFIFPILSILFVQLNAQTSADYTTLYSRIYDNSFSSNSSYNLSNQKTDGTFLNVTTYPTTQPTPNTGAPREHLTEMLKIAKAYQTVGANYHSAAYMTAYLKAWNWWFNYDPQDTNWWWRSIGWTKSLYPSFVLMGRDLKTQYPTDYANMVTYFKHDWTTALIKTYSTSPTGANTTDVCNYMLAVGIVDQDATIINQVAGIMKNALSIVTGAKAEGIQPDYGFSQHTGFGRQLYLANYGKEYINGMLEFITITAGTFFQLPDNKIEVLEYLFLNGVSWNNYRNIFDQNQYGRFPEANYYSSFTSQLSTLLSVNTPQKAALQKLYNWMTRSALNNAANVQVGNQMFWRHDYMVHKGANYMVSTRMTSTRTVGCESGNNAGLDNYYTGSGVNYLYVTGSERYDIVANQNWRRLPGITAPQKPITTALPLVEWGDKSVNLDAFAGGVSDGITGACGFIYNKNQTETNLKAYKSYFYFSNYYVQLGAGITAGKNYNVPYTTTVNQVKYNGIFTIDYGGIDVNLTATQNTHPATTNWAFINNVGYHFLKNTGLNFQTLTLGTTPIAWIGFDHGNMPVNEQYAFAVYPGIPLSNLKNNVTNPSFEIIENSTNVQGVYDKNSNIVQLVFYAAGKINIPNNLGTCEVDKPSILQLRWTNDSVFISAANPYCESTPISSLKVTVSGTCFSLNENSSLDTIINVDLPQNEYQGKSVTKGIKKLSTGLPIVTVPKIYVHPNPVKSGESVTFNLPESADINHNFEIYDSSGKLVLQIKPTSNSYKFQFNSLNLKKGIYVIKYKTLVEKLIVI